MECRWLAMLSNLDGVEEVPKFSQRAADLLDSIGTDFSLDDAGRVKSVEATTNHDVKAVEYVLKEKFAADTELAAVLEFTHFACTSEDINNLSHALMLKQALDNEIIPAMDKVISEISRYVFIFGGCDGLYYILKYTLNDAGWPSDVRTSTEPIYMCI